MNTELLFRAVCAAVIIIMLIYYLRREKKLLSIIIGSITGGAALFIVNKYGGALGLDIPLNTFNILGSLILGSPFVVFLVIMNIL